MKISVVIPAYNEEKVIESTLKAYCGYLSRHYEKFEVILVDDGSRDKTLEIAKKCNNVICISYKNNRGKGYAVKRGFLRATGNYIFFTDADLSYAPQNISLALDLLCRTNSSGVVGVRTDKRRNYPFLRRIISDIFAQVVKKAISTPLEDAQCGFKGFEKATAKQIFSMTKICDFGFDFEIIYLLKALKKPVCTIPVSFEHRSETRVRFLKDGFCMLKDLIYIRRSADDGGSKKMV